MKSRPPIPHLVFALAFGICALDARAVDVTVNWPQDALGTYFIPKVMQKPLSQSGTYTLPENVNLWMDCTGVGITGYNCGVSVQKGKVTFPWGHSEERIGLRFDAATNTFSFVTVPLLVNVKQLDFAVQIDNLPPNDKGPADAGALHYRIVYGLHNLCYAGHKVPFAIDAQGRITWLEQVPGVTSSASSISVTGMTFNVVTDAAKWSIGRWNRAISAGNGSFSALSSDDSYLFDIEGKSKASASFFINDKGLLAIDKDGPFQEVIDIKDPSGASLGKIEIPNGDAIEQARLAQIASDRQTHDTALKTSETAPWKQDFKIADKMDIYDYPEEQLDFKVQIPDGVDPAQLKLLSFSENQVRLIPFQLSNLEKKDGTTTATLSLRSDLPRKATLLFRLVSGFDAGKIPALSTEAPSVQASSEAHSALLQNSLAVIKVPAGHADFTPALPLAKAPAPILSIARKADPTSPLARGSFEAPDSLEVESMDGKLVESGPLFAVYQISYTLKGGKSYVVKLELRAGEDHAAVSEYMTGFTREDTAFLRLDYGQGLLDPNRRFVGSNSGYDLFSGDYDRSATNGKLNFCIGIFTPNGLGVMRSATFYRQEGGDALMLAINHIRDWQTSKRALYSSSGAPENLRFFSSGAEKYMTAGISGTQRFWVFGVIPRDEVKLTNLPGVKALPVGPEVRLFNQLSIWSLNAYKDRMGDWQENTQAAPFDAPGERDYQYGIPWKKMTYDDYAKRFLFEGSTFFRDWVTFGSNFGGYSDRALPAYFVEYALNRASWTPEQREQIRQILLTMADYAESDDNQPHHSMMSGHPNFVMDTKQVLPYAIATFPNHPRAKAWRDSYMEFFNEWLDKYSRKDVPELNTMGGRWTENIACYTGQCFVGVTPDQEYLKFYDGTSLARNPQTLVLLRWMRDSMMSPNDGVRMFPPEGAHSHAMNPGGTFWNNFFQFCAEIAPEDPELSAGMKWLETNGKEGKKPDVHSELFTDYGAVLHYDFGGPDESYAHLQNIHGLDYRWSGAGIVYYGAKGKVWSYNTMETNGDQFNLKELSAFTVKGKGLESGPTDQLLYDFGFAQFYRQPGEGAYRARALMLVRDDYLVISDEVATPQMPGTFNWVNVYDLPQIYQLKPGAPVVDGISRDPQPPRPGAPDRIAKMKSYSGLGDFLTIVAPAQVQAVAAPFGATVNGEFVFASQQTVTTNQGSAIFEGTYGYARPNQIALFQGTRIGLGGLGIRRDGGDFGISASLEQGMIKGRVVGRSGGRVWISVPGGAPLNARVTLDGKPVDSTIDKDAISFSFDIAQKDGIKDYQVSLGK